MRHDNRGFDSAHDARRGIGVFEGNTGPWKRSEVAVVVAQDELKASFEVVWRKKCDVEEGKGKQLE